MTPAELDRLVPKRIRWAGWTLNFAHRAAWLVLLGSVVLAAGPTLLVVLSRRAGPLEIILTTAGSVALIVALSAWEACRSRG